MSGRTPERDQATLEADDATSGKMVWQRVGYDLHTVDGLAARLLTVACSGSRSARVIANVGHDGAGAWS